jgi:hypothetical protein
MGLLVQSIDAQITIYRQYYSQSIYHEKFQLATHYVELIHNTLPPRARITDFKSFELLAKNFNYTSKINSKMIVLRLILLSVLSNLRLLKSGRFANKSHGFEYCVRVVRDQKIS